MIQVIKRTKIDGEIHETTMAFCAFEWDLMKKHYPADGISFHPINEVVAVKAAKVTDAIPGRDADDDKPDMKNYGLVKDRAMDYFREENWDRALYYFKAAHKLKSFSWLNGKITKCERNLKTDGIAKGKPEKGK